MRGSKCGRWSTSSGITGASRERTSQKSADGHRLLHRGLCELLVSYLTLASTRPEPNRNRQSAEGGSHAHGYGRTTAGKPRARICGFSIRRQRATCDVHDHRVYQHSNLRLAVFLKQRTHQHPGHNVDTDCAIDSGG